MATINDIRPQSAIPTVTFDWSPKSTSFTITHAGNTYPWGVNLPSAGAPDQPDQNNTATNQLLTFTATVTGLDSGVSIIEYFWRWGDGTIGYGSPATHTYKASTAQTRVQLTVTDSIGRRFTRARQLLLTPASLISLGQGIIAP